MPGPKRVVGSRLARRQFLSLAALAPLRPRAGQAAYVDAPEPLPRDVILLTAGPGTGAPARWGAVLAPALARALAGTGAALRSTVAGGADGVTAANQFAADAMPDGGTALLAPGDAALSWLAGDPRARFDILDWVPVLAALAPSVVAGRMPRKAAGGQALRVAVAAPGGPDFMALLALDLLGIPAEPVYGLTDEASRLAALAEGGIDVLLLRGPHVPARLDAVTAAGGQGLFAAGDLTPTAAGAAGPLPPLPSFDALYAARRATAPQALLASWRAAAAAAEVEAALVLPQLTPASLVALWRRAGSEAEGSPELRAASRALAIRPVPAAEAGIRTAAMAADADSQLALRQWLATRLNYRPA